jgi:CBS domain-containing protein
MRRIPHYKSRDRGPLEFKSRLHREEGPIMSLARKPVITISPTTKIKDAAGLMVKHKVRRLPVTDPGTGRLIGILRTRDIVDFLGGGEKHMIVQSKFNGNFFVAINEPVRTIMSEEVICGTSRMSVMDVVKILLDKGVGGVPILDDDGRIVGIVSERDFISYVPVAIGIPVSYYMARHVVTAEPTLSILDAARRMISMGFRRLPVTQGRELVGMVTTVDILRYFGTSKVFEHMCSHRMEEAMAVGVQEIMTRDVLKVTPETDAGEAAGLMRERGCGGLPVVSAGELVGIITEHDMLRLLI